MSASDLSKIQVDYPEEWGESSVLYLIDVPPWWGVKSLTDVVMDTRVGAGSRLHKMR